MSIFKQHRINKENLAKLDMLENDGMIDMMTIQFERFKTVNQGLVRSYSVLYVWHRWLKAEA
jgi:hypothetical protein